jgi:uncharacterized protein YkwD
MRAAVHADMWNVAPLRTIPAAALSALFLCAFVGASQAPAAAASQAGVKGNSLRRSAHARHHARCARPSSFHSTGGKTHHSTRPSGCSKRHSAAYLRAHAHRRPARRHKARKRVLHRSKAHSLYGYAPSGAPPLAHYGDCPDTTLMPSSTNIERVRAAILCLVNRERTSRGESALAPDARLQQAAQAHTESMALRDYFEHDGPSGETPLSRIRATGYIYSSQLGYEVGENIGWGTLWKGSPRSIVAAWMASPGHRANILDARFRNTGVGVSPHPPSSLAHNHAGGIYTQDFGVLIRG